MPEAFHLQLLTESIDSATLTDLTPVNDGIIRIDGDNIVVPVYNQIPLAYVIGANVTLAQLRAPSLNRTWPTDLNPLNVGAAPLYPTRMIDLSMAPVTLVPNEQLRVAAAEDAAGASRVSVGLWLAPRRLSPVSGEIHTMRATGATALTANAWTNVPLTLSQNLPAGVWGLVGMSARSATAVLARAVFVGGNYRPGCVASPTVGLDSYYLFRNGNLGIWGEFEHNNVPSVDFFATAADAAEEVFLDLIKLR